MNLTVLIDSWAWIEYLKGSKEGQAVEKFLDKNEKVITSSVNLAEVFGFLLRHQGEEFADEGLQFVMESAFIIPVDVDIAVEAALAKKEKKFGLADAIVCATAKSRNATIVTGDSDFINESNVQFLGSR